MSRLKDKITPDEEKQLKVLNTCYQFLSNLETDLLNKVDDIRKQKDSVFKEWWALSHVE